MTYAKCCGGQCTDRVAGARTPADGLSAVVAELHSSRDARLQRAHLPANPLIRPPPIRRERGQDVRVPLQRARLPTNPPRTSLSTASTLDPPPHPPSNRHPQRTFAKRLTSAPVVVSQIFTNWSNEPLMTRFPSGEKASAHTIAECPFSRRHSCQRTLSSAPLPDRRVFSEGPQKLVRTCMIENGPPHRRSLQ